MTSSVPQPATDADLDAARLMLSRMGISPSDLLYTERTHRVAPTFTDYIPVVATTVSPATLNCYGPYWNYVAAALGPRRIDDPPPSEVKELGEYVRLNVFRRRNARDGRYAVEHFIAALRRLYR